MFVFLLQRARTKGKGMRMDEYQWIPEPVEKGMTAKQLALLWTKLTEVMKHGYGQVTVVIKQGKVLHVETTQSYKPKEKGEPK